MDGWNLALLVVAAYVAIATLVRLMLSRRNQLVDEFRRDVAKEKEKEKEKDKGRHKPEGDKPQAA
jgi:CHASE2 domain-containing sensor protein